MTMFFGCSCCCFGGCFSDYLYSLWELLVLNRVVKDGMYGRGDDEDEVDDV